MLLMKKEFFDAIRRGDKTTTVRLWRHRRVRPGAVHTVPGLGKVRIEDVQTVALAELTESDAAADGFASLADLRAALARMYPEAELDAPAGAADADGRKLYLVHFTFPAGGDE